MDAIKGTTKNAGYAKNAMPAKFGNIPTLTRTLKSIYAHPHGGWHGLTRFAKWQIATRMLRSGQVQLPWIDDTFLILERGMQGATGNYYCGLLEYSDMSFVLDCLEPGDLFVDVGANVGVYTILASGVCKADSIALEPGDQAFRQLRNHVRVNNMDDLVEVHKTGASNTTGFSTFLAEEDAVNRIVLGNEEFLESTVTVRVDLLDNILKGRVPTIIKIDVEGWEVPVLEGSTRTLESEKLLALIVEVNDVGERYGYKAESVLDIMEKFGFSDYSYFPQQRLLTPGIPNNSNNIIFIRDPKLVKERISRAPLRRIN